MVVRAFDAGICHFDLANNYGPVPGSAETNFGRILKNELASHRDEMFVSSKAGHEMWPGVYGTGSSRKNLMASCDQSLKRTGLEYFDIFYSHRYDGVTPIEETMQALIDLVHQGKALYVGISKYPPELQQRCYDILKEAHVPCLLSQYRCSMFDPKAKMNNFQIAADNGSGIICFSPLAQGLLTGKYNNGIPEGSRAARSTGFLQQSQVTPERVEAVKKSSHLQRGRDGTHQQHHQHPLTLVLTMKKFTVLLCLLLTLYGCSDDATSTFSNREHVYCAFDVVRADVLFNVMGNYGQFASIRKRAMEGKTQIELVSSTGLKGYYPVDQLSNNFGLGLGGLIVGTSNFGEALCYDLACPICDRSDRRLTLTADGHAKCAKCGVSYDLNNYGVIYQVPENAQLSTRRGLYRYRINFNGQIVNAYN